MKKTLTTLLSLILYITLALQHAGWIVNGESVTQSPKKGSTLSYLTQIGAPKVWKLKDSQNRFVMGEGITVAVIDGGIDPKHPDFLGMNWGGYDVVRKQKSLIDTDGHGTHVAGIVKRVAPKVDFLFYRAMGSLPSLIALNICEAMERAINDGADVINLSLAWYPDSGLAKSNIFQRVMKKAYEKGIVVVVGAGNSGPSKGTITSSLADLNNVITVGASTKVIPIPTIQINGDKRVIETIPATMVSPSLPPNGTYQVVDFKKRTNLKKVKGKLILVKRGSSLINDFLVSAKKAGAVGVIAYNDRPGEWNGTKDVVRVRGSKKKIPPFVTVSGRTGEYIKQHLAKGNNKIVLGVISKERMAFFSSAGPSPNTKKSPDVVAPGQDIYSSVPLKICKTGYKMWSGTSMATPMVTGAVALIKQMYPTLKPNQIKALLANNATTLLTSENVRAPYLCQGSGRIDIWKAIHAESLLTPSQLRFGVLKQDILKTATSVHNALYSMHRKLYITNTTKKTKMYRFKLELKTGNQHLAIQLPSTIELNANEKKAVPIDMNIYPNIPKGIYTGSIIVDDGTQKQKVPWTLYIIEKSLRELF